ncbi:hypothetical protein JIN82_01000 [Persicirhabdus sediminis]|uniref:Uncharacterized protein n=1 Tax=Persicirhabdus sediminis TaxID=454144 RepID=A0A8J7MBU7_9BACT|nr:hypothetical protein [Persicirhabdus sediminis]
MLLWFVTSLALQDSRSTKQEIIDVGTLYVSVMPEVETKFVEDIRKLYQLEDIAQGGTMEGFSYYDRTYSFYLDQADVDDLQRYVLANYDGKNLLGHKLSATVDYEPSGDEAHQVWVDVKFYHEEQRTQSKWMLWLYQFVE